VGGNRLFVGGISFSTTDVGLSEAFTRFGRIKQSRIMTERETGKSRGFAFVEYERDDDAAKACVGMNGVALDGRTLRVEIAEAKQRAGGPPKRSDAAPVPEVVRRGQQVETTGNRPRKAAPEVEFSERVKSDRYRHGDDD
jgi:RNA recognition motif-containing protein